MAEIDTTTDGRRLRSRDSKRKIVAAMLELVREGQIAPKAEDIAVRAQVGLRTVFRHFKDMQSLYAEMSSAISEQVAPILDEPLNAQDWHENLARLLTRRKRVFEAIMPYRIAANALRYQSHVLLTRHQQIIRDERDKLMSVIPQWIQSDITLIRALESALSFDMWSELRNDQRLSLNDAGRVVDRIIYSLLESAEIRLNEREDQAARTDS